MKFEWDDNKNQLNITKHGIDFNDAKRVFEDNKRLSSEDNRKNYGEKRWITIGKLKSVLIVVVYTHKTDVIRIISARLASKKEREKYNVKPGYNENN